MFSIHGYENMPRPKNNSTLMCKPPTAVKSLPVRIRTQMPTRLAQIKPVANNLASNDREVRSILYLHYLHMRALESKKAFRSGMKNLPFMLASQKIACLQG